VFFLPIFFTYTGLRTSIGGLDTWADWGLCLAIVATASIAKLGGGYLAARRSGFDHPQSAIMITTPALRHYLKRTALVGSSGIGVDGAGPEAAARTRG